MLVVAVVDDGRRKVKQEALAPCLCSLVLLSYCAFKK
jgi:hypothetical protein